MVSRTILVLKNINMKKILDIIMNQLLSDAYIYINANSIDLTEE